jgi:hypothetical protein
LPAPGNWPVLFGFRCAIACLAEPVKALGQQNFISQWLGRCPATIRN